MLSFPGKKCGKQSICNYCNMCSICFQYLQWMKLQRERPNMPYLLVTTSLQISGEGANFSSSIIYHAWRASPRNRHNVFTCLNLTDHITSLWDNHRQSVKSTPCSRGHNYKSQTVWSLIQTFLLLFSPPTATGLLWADHKLAQVKSQGPIQSYVGANLAYSGWYRHEWMED